MRVEVARVVAVVLVVVLDRDGVERRGDLEDGDAVGDESGEDAQQALLEAEAVGHDQVGAGHAGRLLGGRLELVGIGAGRDEHLDGRLVAGDRRDDVAEDVGGDDDARLPALPSAAGGEQGGEDHRDGRCLPHPVTYNENRSQIEVITPVSVSSHHRQVESRLADSGVRYTPGRRAVVDVLGSAEGPLGAAEIHERLHGRVPLSSVYRTLAVLEEAGVLIPHFAQKGLTRYELAEWLRGHHHHLVCIGCGGVEDVTLPDPLEAEMDRIVKSIGKLTEFSATSHSLEIEGRCARCDG
nr:MAG: hypothetical protein DIU67_07895 [Actinomycetota bacterium]